MKKAIFIVLACMLVTSVIAGCGIAQKLGLQSSEELQPVSSTFMGEEEAVKLADKVPLKLYFGEKDGNKLIAEIRHVPKSEIKVNTYTTVVRELLKGPSSTATMKAVIPEGTQLVNSINVEKGIATVDLSKEFTDKFSKEKDIQSLTVFSIVNSLTEIKEIDKVKFTVGGKAIREVNSFRLDTVFDRNTAILGKAVPSTTFFGAPSASPSASPKQDPKKP